MFCVVLTISIWQWHSRNQMRMGGGVVIRYDWPHHLPIYWAVDSFITMDLLPDTLRMRRECRERFPRHRLQSKPLVSDPDMHHDTCVTHVPWWMSGSRVGGKNLPGIPSACPTRNFTYLVRGPCLRVCVLSITIHYTLQCQYNKTYTPQLYHLGLVLYSPYFDGIWSPLPQTPTEINLANLVLMPHPLAAVLWKIA